MNLNDEQIKELKILSKPLIKWINENGNPHSIILIDCDSSRIFSGLASINTDEFIKD